MTSFAGCNNGQAIAGMPPMKPGMLSSAPPALMSHAYATPPMPPSGLQPPPSPSGSLRRGFVPPPLAFGGSMSLGVPLSGLQQAPSGSRTMSCNYVPPPLAPTGSPDMSIGGLQPPPSPAGSTNHSYMPPPQPATGSLSFGTSQSGMSRQISAPRPWPNSPAGTLTRPNFPAAPATALPPTGSGAGHLLVAPSSSVAIPVMPQPQAGSTVSLVRRTPQWPPAVPGLICVMLDTNGDGVIDAAGWDTNGDGFIDALDMDGDGMIDTMVVILTPPELSKAAEAESEAHEDNDDAMEMTEEERLITNRASEMYDEIDADGNGKISKLEFLAAIQRDCKFMDALLPGSKQSHDISRAETFDLADAAFAVISQGKKRIDKQHFITHFRKAAMSKSGSETASLSDDTSESDSAREIFGLIDSENLGSFSKFDLVGALQHHEAVAAFIVPGIDSSNVLNDERTFDVVDSLFCKVANGKKRIELQDFEAYFCNAKLIQPVTLHEVDRGQKRVLVIGPGFGRELNPRQCELLNRSGYQVQWMFNLPNPEQLAFPMMRYMQQIKADIDEFKPHLVACASKGGHYMTSLWQSGVWRGPTLMINAHPSIKQLPKKMRIVIAHGSEDDLYQQSRTDLENLAATASKNTCFLYWAGSSGRVSSGACSRYGDKHNMESLLSYDCLPRLIDAALSPTDPETHMIWSWRQRLSIDRCEAEKWLGHSPADLQRFWVSADDEGTTGQMVFEVPHDSEEFRQVEAIYYAEPKEPATYQSTNPAWSHAKILKVERVENRCQLEGSAIPHFCTLRKSVEDQGVCFEPGVHTRWVFHGTNAVESIVNNPLTGFQPLACGSRLGTLWGSGTYFARDAKYVVDSNFCSGAADGTYRMLMCLVMSGIPCLGSPDQKGVLPFRQKPHRYQSTVDSLSSPEVFIVQHPSAAYPAYVITFASADSIGQL